MSFTQPPFWAVNSPSMQSLHAIPVVVTPPAIEPLSVTEVISRLRINTGTAETADLVAFIRSARRQVEKDLGGACLVSRVIDQWHDRAPCGRVLDLVRWPVQSVDSVKSHDASDVESTFPSSNYLVDTAGVPGRVILNESASWPTSLRRYKSLVVRHTCGFSGTAKTVSIITRSSATATVTTSAAHGYATGNRITIAGADQADYNGTFEITVTGAATFTFTVSNSPVTPATGVITATDLGIPDEYLLAMMLLIVHWYFNRQPVTDGVPNMLQLSYNDLLDARVIVP